MPTVQGAGSVHPNVTAGTNYAVAQQASSLIASAVNVQARVMTGGGTAPTVPGSQYGELIVDTSGGFIGGGIGAAGYTYFVVGDTPNPLTITAGGLLGQTAIFGTGVATYNAAGGSGTVVGGDGNKTINAGPGTNFALYTGAGDDTINLSSSPAAGQNTVAAGGGHNLVNLGAAPTQIIASGADTINVSAGSTTVQAIGGAQASVAGGSGQRTVVNAAGSSTVFGGAGSATVVGGAGGGQFYGGASGSNLLLGGSGGAYLTGATSGDVLIATSTSAMQVLQAGAGNETLLGALSTADNLFSAGSGADLIIAGSGNDTILAGSGYATVTGGAGSDSFTFNALVAHGGNMTITDFTPGADHVVLRNYPDSAANLAASAKLVAPATARVTLSDGASITFLHISSVDASFFA